MTLSQFVSNYINDKVDYDNAFGCQCVDLFRQYVLVVLGHKKHTGAVAGAKDLFLKYSELPEEQKVFDRIKTKTAKVGDCLVWGETKTNPYGHVAICLGQDKENLIVFEQDGYKQNGAKVMTRKTENLLGVLRPKKSVWKE